MFGFKLVCPCGFETDEAYWYVSQDAARGVAFAVYDPVGNRLFTHQFGPFPRAWPDESIDSWIATHARQEILNTASSRMVIIAPDNVEIVGNSVVLKDKCSIFCPRCKQCSLSIATTKMIL